MQSAVQLERRIADLERLVKQLLAPKSKARIILPDNTSSSGGDQILFEIVDVVCAEGEEMYILVEWTHYTGSCGTEPPGVDPYTGYIQVYDSCVLAYYTTDFLLGPAEGAGVTGRATYWYPRADGYGNCEPRWIVDNICGTPECS